MNRELLYKKVVELKQRFEAKGLTNLALDIAEIWSDIHAKATLPNSNIKNNLLISELYIQRIAPYWTFLE